MAHYLVVLYSQIRRNKTLEVVSQGLRVTDVSSPEGVTLSNRSRSLLTLVKSIEE